MRIGFDAKRYFHNTTGLGNYSRSLIRHMVSEHTSHDYVLFAQQAETETQANYTLVTGNNPFWRQLGITKAIRKYKLDIYHGLSAELPLSKPADTKFVVTIHDLIFQKYPAYYKTLDRFIYALKIDNALKMADHVVVTSEQTKSDLIESFPKYNTPITVIYQDCAPQFYQPLDDEELNNTKTSYQLADKFLLMVSKFEERKNHLNLLKALVHESIEIPVVMVGRPGNTFNQVQQYIKKNDLGAQVTIIEDVTDTALCALYQLAHWTIYPSLYEGFGIPVVESFASGTPVLTSENTSMSELTGEAGILFNPSDPNDIGVKIKQAFSGDAHQVAVSNIPNQLKQVNQSAITEQYLNLYKTLHA